ncbi:sensor histidine kinase [Dankookia sp. GCM10030260]|uniref:sensor histidine kinase n=1 Tax=Dankookia sp. GCM10030260 TaxID=3273390 RepID=UPI00360E1268
MADRRIPEGAGPPAPAADQPFNLVRWFALLGLLWVSVSAIGLASLLTSFLSAQMLQRDAEVSADFIRSEVIVKPAAEYFAGNASSAGTQELEAFFGSVARLPDVVRANVYSADGTVLWSSNPALIGRKFLANRELQHALAGGIAVAHGVIAQEIKPEYASFGAEAQGNRYMEAYLPIRAAGDGRVIGVVEIYRLPRSLFRTIDQGVRMVWAAALASAGFLYAMLFWMIRRADRLLRSQREQLIEAETLATVGTFASAVAHGVRNPLASMRSSAELAVDEEDPAARREMLGDILREADRLEGWVRDLLLGARGEAMAPSSVAVNPLLDEAARSFASLARDRDVRLTLRTPPVPAVCAEAGLLGRAMDNIIANAIEAVPCGGEVVIETAADRDGSMVEIRVADTGPGLSPDVVRRVARPFYSTKPQGTGLGLALARRIVASYAGTLVLDSTEGRGTTVTIRLRTATE